MLLLVVSKYNVKAQMGECPCNPLLTAKGDVSNNDNARCSCYICLIHEPWKPSHRDLNTNEGSTRIYAPNIYQCPNIQHKGGWNHIDDYQWLNNPGATSNGNGYQPNPILYERTTKKDKWESEIDKMIRVGHITGIKSNPCKSDKKGKPLHTFAICWYQVNAEKTQQIIESKKTKKQDTAHVIDDIYYNHESESNSYNYINEYLMGIELILIGEIFMILICCIVGVICGYALKRIYDSRRDDGKNEFDRNRMD